MPGQKLHYLTPEGKAKLDEELEYLRTVRRAEIAVNLRAAIEEGDLSENAGYDETKREQAFLEGRIQEIENILRNMQILADDERSSTGAVAMGSHVTVVEEGSATPETYHLVGAAEADPLEGRISNESPLGRALLGKRAGDSIAVNTPGGLLRFRVLETQ